MIRASALRMVQGAIGLSAHVIAKDPDQFASRVVGRLLPHREIPGIAEFGEKVAEGTQTSWLRSLQPALLPPGTALVRILEGHSDVVTGVAVTPDGKRAVSVSYDNTLRVWEVESGRELRTLQGHTNWVGGVALSGDGRLAVSASEDMTLNVWELETGRVFATLTCDGWALCCMFSDALNLVVAGDAGGHVHFLRLEEPKTKKLTRSQSRSRE